MQRLYSILILILMIIAMLFPNNCTNSTIVVIILLVGQIINRWLGDIYIEIKKLNDKN